MEWLTLPSKGEFLFLDCLNTRILALFQPSVLNWKVDSGSWASQPSFRSELQRQPSWFSGFWASTMDSPWAPACWLTLKIWGLASLHNHMGQFLIISIFIYFCERIYTPHITHTHPIPSYLVLILLENPYLGSCWYICSWNQSVSCRIIY